MSKMALEGNGLNSTSNTCKIINISTTIYA
jgi:hypothetical protein